MWKARRGMRQAVPGAAFSSLCSRLSVERRSPSATASSWQHLGSATQRHAASGLKRQKLQKLAALLIILILLGILARCDVQALIPPIEDAFEDVSRLGEACNSWLSAVQCCSMST